MFDIRVAILVSLLLIMQILALYTYPWFGFHTLKMNERTMPSWQKAALWKRQQIYSQIPKDWILAQSILDEAHQRNQLSGGFIDSLLDDRARDITSLTSQELLDSMANRSMTAVQVTEAFCKRSAIAHQIVNHKIALCADI